MKMSFKESMILTETRREDLTYTEKLVKNKVDKVIVELNGSKSASLTKLAKRYDRLKKAIEMFKEKEKEYNQKIKSSAEDLFNAEDIVLTRIVETASFTLNLSKRMKADDKTDVNYEKIAEELSKLVSKELEEKVNEIYKAHTKVIEGQEKAVALRVSAKKNKESIINESIIGDFLRSIMDFLKNLLKDTLYWAVGYDRKLAKLKKDSNIK